MTLREIAVYRRAYRNALRRTLDPLAADIDARKVIESRRGRP